MHDIDSTRGESDLTGLEVPEPESFEYNFEQDGETEFASESPFGEIEETELAEELLTIQSEEELDQFLGKLVKKAWRGVKKFAKSGVGRALGWCAERHCQESSADCRRRLGKFHPDSWGRYNDRESGGNGCGQSVRGGSRRNGARGAGV